MSRLRIKTVSLFVSWLFCLSYTTAGMAADVAVDSVYPALSKLGEELDIRVSGSGFDGNTRVAAYLDSGNRRFIKGSIAFDACFIDVAVVSDKAYIVDCDFGLRIFDISAPSNPRELGTIETPGFTRAIEVVGDTAYLADYEAGLAIVDISDPTNPVIIGSVDTPDFALDISVVGNTVYIANNEADLQIIDITTPSEPVIIATLAIPSLAYGISVVGDTAYIAAYESGLQIVDVSSPQSPVIIASVQSDGYVYGITVVGNTAYVAASNYGLQIIDVSTPSSPQVLGEVDTPGEAQSVAVVGETAYVADLIAGLQIIDVSEPQSPQIIGVVDTPGAAYQVTVVGDTAYAADHYDGGLQIIDVKAPSTQLTIGTAATAGTAQAVTLVDNLAYVAGDEGMSVIDVSIPSAPILLGGIATDDSRGVIVIADRAYMIDSEGLHVIDISTPANPFIMGSVALPDTAYGFDIAGDLAYVAADDSGLQIIDISTDTSPTIIGAVDTPGTARAVAIDGATAYVADFDAGLQIIDISLPQNPVIVGTVDTEANALDVAVVGETVYVADDWEGLIIIDLTSSIGPRIDGQVRTNDSAQSVTIIGDRAYVANDGAGLQIIDISISFNPVIIGVVDTPGTALAVAVVNNTAYVADGDNGLVIVPLPVEIDPLIVNSSTELALTLPSPTLAGHYTLRVFNSNEFAELFGAVTFSDGLQTFSNTTLTDGEAPSSDAVSKAIIVAGGGPYPGNNLWEATRRSANFAYQALLFQGYRRENIYYLNPDTTIDADGDGILNDIDATANSANLEDAILNWATDPQAPAYELVLYIVDHGGDSQFRLNETELLSAIQLDTWLDELQQDLPGKLLVIYDACQSGTFIPHLLPPEGKDRIVMTSAGDENAFFINQGGLSFSFQFWSSIFSGGSLYDSFVFGKRMMQEFQTAQIDSNGNGIAGEKADKTLAQGLVLGRGYVPASDKPFISAVSAPQILTDTTTATISASGIIDATGISRVWGVISHPEFSLGEKDVPVLNAPEIELTDADGDNTWTGTYDQFTLPGTYSITIYALNNNGFYSASTDLQSNTTTVQQLSGSGDSDGDGIADDIDAFPSDPSESIDTDGDGIGNNADSDDDNDGVPDFNDAFPLDSTRSSHVGGSSDSGEVTYTNATGEMLVPLLEVALVGEEVTSYGPVTMSYSPSCAGVVFTLTGAKEADAALLADVTITAATFNGASGELAIPRIEVITQDIFGTSIISIYTEVIMVLAPDCPGTSLRVIAATVVE